MIRRHLFALRLQLLAADAVMAVVVYLIVGQLRFGDATWPTMWHAWSQDVRVGAVLYAALWVSTLWFLGLYASRVRWTITGEFSDILVASFLLSFGTMSFLFLVRLAEVSRSFLLIVIVVQPLVTMGTRLILRAFFNRLRSRGHYRCHMVVVGVGVEAQSFADSVEAHSEFGIRVIGHLRAQDEGDGVVTRPILGAGEDLARVFHERIVDEVAICVAPRAMDWAEPLIRLAADEGKHVRIPTRIPVHTVDLQTEELDGMVIRSYVHGPTRMLSLTLKRTIDLVGAVIGLVVLGPVFLLIAVVIAFREGSPILFHQTRVGLHGRPFTLHKFRTMVPDAEARLDDLATLSDTKGAAFTMRHDPRVTPLGAFLRRSSLDELPQLWNVLTGSMSLIGPRPAPLREVAGYDIWHRRRLSMRPGITGLSQIRTRVDGHFDDRAVLDLTYIDHWSLAADMKILARTVSAVVGGMDRQPHG